ncbi:transposase [Jannaschia sp. 2305UL9-9]|uniref:transposase n=1 Tax=Jannaschia sp. 2305UL9-9 TaxID=3121638 RepID=UPI003528EE37
MTIRELMDDRHGEYPLLSGAVEADEGYLGGAPTTLVGAAKPGSGSTVRPMVLVAADRDGYARAAVVPNKAGATLAAKVADWIDPDTAWPMTERSQSYNAAGQQMQVHSKVIHSQGQYANPIIGARVNIAEAVISMLRRALIRVFHKLPADHLQRTSTRSYGGGTTASRRARRPCSGSAGLAAYAPGPPRSGSPSP